MQFALDEFQTLLRDSARRWTREHYPQPQRVAARKSALGYSAEHWQEMAELGWLAMLVPEAQGGLGRPIVDAAIVAEELGRRLCLEPFTAVAGYAAALLAQHDNDPRVPDWLSRLSVGQLLVSVAHTENEARGLTLHVTTKAERVPGGWRLQGHKQLLRPARSAELLLISARTRGNPRDREGLTLFAVSATTPGLSFREYPTIDGGRASDLTLHDVTVPDEAVLGTPDNAFESIERATAIAKVLACAEAVGMMDEALWMTRDYLRERQQFGGPIARFQALQHRAADMYIETSVARAALWQALAKIDDPDASTRESAVNSMKARVGQSARFVCSQAIQLHGGIGVTEEHAIGHYFKRMCMLDAVYGTANDHLRLTSQSLR